MAAFQLQPSRLLAILGAIILITVVLASKVRYTHGDSRYSLLASQAFLEQGNFRLDNYGHDWNLSAVNNGKDWMIYYNPAVKHVYYDYPIGTPLFSVPFVAVARALGMVPADMGQDSELQMYIAAFLLAVIFLLLFRLALLYLDEWAALLFATLYVYGTSLASVLGTALWSADFQTLFILLAILEIAEAVRGKREKIRGGWLGFLLFAAYLCKPTSMWLILIVFGYMAWKHRKQLWLTMGVSGGLLLLFMLWSWLEMHTILPRYYLPGNWEPYGDAAANFWPILIGPARGLFSFTPVLLLAFVGWGLKKLRKDPLFWAMWLWLAFQTWMILRSKNPWGGWCYGPRLYVEVLPGMALALLMTLEGVDGLKPRLRNALAGLFLVFSVFGVYVHTWQGLYAPVTNSWNAIPYVDQAWRVVRWDWRYPQFMASHYQLEQRKWENEMAGSVVVLLDQIPEGAALLYGPRTPGITDIMDYWNRHDVLHKGKPVFNASTAIHRAGFKEFWFATDRLEELRMDHRVRIDPPIVQDSIWGPDSVRILSPLPSLGHARFK
jgi:hypothetical protein